MAEYEPSSDKGEQILARLKFNENNANKPIINSSQLKRLESLIDKVFARVGIDVEFTRHFIDRLNDERNKKPITLNELGNLFAKEYKKWGKPIAQMGPDAEAVMKDISTNINIPFVLDWNKRTSMLELKAKTIMRKKDFKTPDKVFPVEGKEVITTKQMNMLYEHYKRTNTVLNPVTGVISEALTYLDRLLEEDSSHRHDDQYYAMETVNVFGLNMSSRKLLRLREEWKPSGEDPLLWARNHMDNVYKAIDNEN